MDPNRKMWLTVGVVCGALLLVPMAGFALLAFGPLKDDAKKGATSVKVIGSSSPSSAAALLDDGALANAPARVRACCKNVEQKASHGKVEDRDEYLEAAAACKEAAASDTPDEALRRVSSILGGAKVLVPGACREANTANRGRPLLPGVAPSVALPEVVLPLPDGGVVEPHAPAAGQDGGPPPSAGR